MKSVTQLNLFEETELGDLEKILAVVDTLPETGLLEQIESKHKGEPTIAKRIIKNMSQTILDRAEC
ncbi:hypothetical protein IYQ92_09345, partial [Streptococcus sp. HF-1907]|nr:hypothetical protein [Streptococcus sp. HF-1907]